MDSKISKYLKSNKVFTVATCVEDTPYCANCFYYFDEKPKRLYFMSDKTTRHITEAIKNDIIAGTINNEVTTVAKIQGIQFTGRFIVPSSEEEDHFYKAYIMKFPFAITKPASIWGIELEWIKMTDNTLGFGKKLIWKKDEN